MGRPSSLYLALELYRIDRSEVGWWKTRAGFVVRLVVGVDVGCVMVDKRFVLGDGRPE